MTPLLPASVSVKAQENLGRQVNSPDYKIEDLVSRIYKVIALIIMSGTLSFTTAVCHQKYHANSTRRQHFVSKTDLY